MKSLSSLLGITRETDRPTREAAVEMIAGTPEQIAEVLETARLEIAKVKEDKVWVENRLREDIESLRSDRLELSGKLEDKDRQLVQMQKDLTAAKDSAADQAREMLRSSGHAPVADANIDPDAATGPLGHDQKIWSDYQGMKAGAERLAFAEKNSEALARFASSL